MVWYTRTLERENDNTFPFICLIIVNIEGNESFTHNEKFKKKKRENSSRARDVIVIVIPVEDNNKYKRAERHQKSKVIYA